MGLGSAKRFVADGAHVYITGRRQMELDKAVQAIGVGLPFVSDRTTEAIRRVALRMKLAAVDRTVEVKSSSC